jgi:hypothetical protein
VRSKLSLALYVIVALLAAGPALTAQTQEDVSVEQLPWASRSYFLVVARRAN